MTYINQKVSIENTEDSMNPTSIICPNCKTEISIDEALSHQIEDKLKQSLRDEFNKKYLEEKKKLAEKIEEESGKELKLLKEQFEKQKLDLDKAHEFELELRKKTAELEEKEKNLELEKQRQIDEERKKIQEKTETEVTERFHLKEKEKDSIIDSLKKSLEEAQRKANQGSQQLQGEVLELELEEVLRREFPVDQIVEVGKGKLGADIRQVVNDPIGKRAGVIIWETKRTKNWEKAWTSKLKEDMRASKGDLAILVTQVLPEGIRNFGFLDGVMVVGFECFLQVARILRKSLLDLSLTKSLSVGKNEKIEALYRYITSSEFAQKIDSMVETYLEMRKTIEKEKMSKLKDWAEREKQIERLQQSTLSIHGSFAGLIEEPLGQIESLEYPEIELVIEQSE